MSATDLRFLIVDQDPTSRAMIRENLHSFGYQSIWEANRVKEALEVINTQPLDVIISDLDLPGAAGTTLLKLIKSQERFRATAFILISSIHSHEEENVKRAALLGTDGYLLKPFRSSKLRELLQDLKLS